MYIYKYNWWMVGMISINLYLFTTVTSRVPVSPRYSHLVFEFRQSSQRWCLCGVVVCYHGATGIGGIWVAFA